MGTHNICFYGELTDKNYPWIISKYPPILFHCYRCVAWCLCKEAYRTVWAAAWQNQQNDCAPIEDSDQPRQLPSLIRVFAVCSMGSQGSKVSSCRQRWLIRLGGCPGQSRQGLNCGTDKEVYEDNLGIILLISPKKHMLWVLIRITAEAILMSTHNMFLWRTVKIIRSGKSPTKSINKVSQNQSIK